MTVPAANESPLLLGQVLDEKYRIERQLGRGGMGAVYLATHLGTRRPVALKVIAPQFMARDEFVERFRREAEAAGRMRHPNVVDVADFGFARVGAARVAYLVMEYLDGCTLAEVLAEEGRLPLAWVVDIMEQVCSALDAAHRRGTVHRDLKPDNIWLEPNRRGGYTVKVLDFGLAKLRDPAPEELLPDPAALQEAEQLEAATRVQPPANAEEAGSLQLEDAAEARTLALDEAARLVQQPVAVAARPDEEAQTRLLDRQTVKEPSPPHTGPTDGLTRAGSIMGTPRYMSPEQCRGEALDARSDIYSLGVVTYQMLAGRTPFSGDLQALIRQHLEDPPPPPQVKKVPKQVAALVMAALAKDPAARPASAAAYASALRAYSEGAGALLRRAFSLFSEHFPTFMRISLLANLPLFVLLALLFLNDWLGHVGALPPLVTVAADILLNVVVFLTVFLSSSVIAAVTVPVVTQLHLAPQRPVNLRAAFAAVRKRLKPFLTTAVMVSLLIVCGFALCGIPGIIAEVRYALYAPVVMVEGLKNRAAMKRANQLRRRATRTVVLIILVQFALPFTAGVIFGSSGKKVVIEKTDSPANVEQQQQSESQAQPAPENKEFHVGFSAGAGEGYAAKVSSRLSYLANLLIVPLISIMTVLLYLRMRQAGGETLNEALSQFEGEEAVRSQWQRRMRERLSLQLTSRGSRDSGTSASGPGT